MRTAKLPATVRRYVLGFMFDCERSGVVLIRKTNPAWQAGLLNGVGGKIEPGETPRNAMVREFREETGLRTRADKWTAALQFFRGGDTAFCVDVFRNVRREWDITKLVRSTTDEPVAVVPVDLVFIGHVRTLSNLPWIIAALIDANCEGLSYDFCGHIPQGGGQ